MAQRFTAAKKKKFLDVLAATGNVQKTCLAIGIGRKTVYHHRKKSEKFAQDWAAAKDIAIEALEDEAWRRAFEGVEEPVYHQGEIVGYKIKYSDTLLMHRLQAERPEKYQYRQKIDQNVTGNVKIEIVKFSDVKDNTPAE